MTLILGLEQRGAKRQRARQTFHVEETKYADARADRESEAERCPGVGRKLPQTPHQRTKLCSGPQRAPIGYNQGQGLLEAVL